jgi:hypothetical protein
MPCLEAAALEDDNRVPAGGGVPACSDEDLLQATEMHLEAAEIPWRRH